MAKLCTSVEQSRRLVELGLDTNTADMYWIRHWDKEIPRSIQEGYEGKILSKAWSLSALLGVLPNCTDIVKEEADTENEKYMCTVGVKDDIMSTFGNNPVDACVDMIIKLKELNLL